MSDGYHWCCLCGGRIEDVESPFVFTVERLGRVDAGSDAVLWLPGAKAHKLCQKRLAEKGNRFPSELNRCVNMPFRVNMIRALFEGGKTATSRTKRYGIPGDTFVVSGRTFRLIRVKAEKLSIIAREYWEREGCSSSDEFISIWRSIHPRKGWDPEQFVFLHEFELVETVRHLFSPIQMVATKERAQAEVAREVQGEEVRCRSRNPAATEAAQGVPVRCHWAASCSRVLGESAVMWSRSLSEITTLPVRIIYRTIFRNTALLLISGCSSSHELSSSP